MKPLRLLLALCLALAIAGPAAAREWLRADTPNFVIYSDGYPLELERWAKKLESFDALLRRRYAPVASGKGIRLTIYMLEDGDAVAELADRKNLHGIYRTTSEGSFAVTHRKPVYYSYELSGQMSLFHEYAHHFMYRYFPGAYPAWFSEGFAEYASTVSFDMDWRWTMGLPPENRTKWFGKDPLPIGTILFAKIGDIKPKQLSRFYAWSWLLVHMLNSDPRRAAQLDLYLKRFGQGASPEQAAASFGDLGQLERDLRTYATQAPGYVTSREALEADPAIRITTLGATESRLLDLALMRKAGGRIEEACDGLRRLAADNPGNADIQYELAMAERDLTRTAKESDLGLARAAVGRALTIDPDHARANVLAAQIEVQELAGKPGASAADWDAARRKLTIALEHEPDDPLALTAFFRSYVSQRAAPPPLAFAAIRKAFALQPESLEIRLAYAFALSMQGRHAEARQLAQMLASHPHSAGLGERALVTIEKMREAAQGASASRGAVDLESLTRETTRREGPAR